MFSKKSKETATLQPSATGNVVEKIVYASEKEYHDIIRRMADGTEHPTDVERLKGVCADMGITVHFALRDVEMLKKADQLAPIAADTDKLSAEQTAAGGAYVARQQQFEAYQQKEREELGRLNGEYNRLDSLYRRASDAQAALNAIRKANPRAFGEPWRDLPDSMRKQQDALQWANHAVKGKRVDFR